MDIKLGAGRKPIRSAAHKAQRFLAEDFERAIT
jgi:hypothetical protein